MNIVWSLDIPWSARNVCFCNHVPLLAPIGYETPSLPIIMRGQSKHTHFESANEYE